MNINPRKRHGYSLIEMITVMSCMTAILTLTAGLIGSMLRLERGERGRAVAASSLERLGSTLRSDAHAATAQVEVTEGKLIVPLADGQSIEYLVREDDVLRTDRRKGKPNRMELFRRPIRTSARFVSVQEGAVRLIVLQLATINVKPSDPVYRDYRIEAEVGRNARLDREVRR